MHLVEFQYDLGGIRNILHDPLAFDLIDKMQKFLGGRGFESPEKIGNEALIGVGVLPSLGMIFLQDRHHARGQQTDVVLVGGPEED
jgi:hypothetical protein